MVQINGLSIRGTKKTSFHWNLENAISVRTTMNMKGVNGDVTTMKTLNQIMTELLQKQKKKEYL